MLEFIKKNRMLAIAAGAVLLVIPLSFITASTISKAFSKGNNDVKPGLHLLDSTNDTGEPPALMAEAMAFNLSDENETTRAKRGGVKKETAEEETSLSEKFRSEDDYLLAFSSRQNVDEGTLDEPSLEERTLTEEDPARTKRESAATETGSVKTKSEIDREREGREGIDETPAEALVEKVDELEAPKTPPKEKATPPKKEPVEKKDPPKKPARTTKKPSSPQAYKKGEHEVSIAYFILDEEKRFHLSARNPILVTLVVKAPNEAKFAQVNVYARKVGKDNTLLSKEKIFFLPKIYVVEGRAQTQFAWSGKKSQSSAFLSKGKYLLYAEVSVYDRDWGEVGNTARYPLPKWTHVVEVR